MLVPFLGEEECEKSLAGCPSASVASRDRAWHGLLRSPKRVARLLQKAGQGFPWHRGGAGVVSACTQSTEVAGAEGAGPPRPPAAWPWSAPLSGWFWQPFWSQWAEGYGRKNKSFSLRCGLMCPTFTHGMIVWNHWCWF